MAQLTGTEYKPPMLLLEYEVNEIVEPGANVDDSTFNLFGFQIEDKSVKIGNTNLSLSGLADGTSNLFTSSGTQTKNEKINLNGKNFQSGNLNLGLDKVIQKVKSIFSKNVNNTMDYKSSTTKGGLNKLSTQDAINYLNPVQGWAWIRSKDRGNSILPNSSDERPHIILRRMPPGAPDDDEGVIWVKESTYKKSSTPTPTSPDYTNRSDTYAKWLRGKTTRYFDAETGQIGKTDYGDNQYRIVILEDSALDIASGYCCVRYYTGFEVTKNGTELDIKDDPTDTHIVSGDVPTFPEDDLIADANILSKNPQATTAVKKSKKYIVDFYKFSHWPNEKFGFGIEQFNFSGDSRKSIQQTRGTYEKGKASKNNFYVDTWGKGPETLVLAGAMELPFAYDPDIATEVLEEGVGSRNYKSFIDTIDDFFLWSNNPENVNAGETLYLFDYYKKITYRLTFKSNKFTQSVEKQSIINFEFVFIILEKSEIIEDYRK